MKINLKLKKQFSTHKLHGRISNVAEASGLREEQRTHQKTNHFTTSTTTYPWKLRAEKEREKGNNLWAVIKKKHLLNIGTSRIKDLLRSEDAPYSWPYQFELDTQELLTHAFKAMSDRKRNSVTTALSNYMIEGLANSFASSNRMLIKDQDLLVSWRWTAPPKIYVNGFYFTYGPFPVPQDYIAQDWIDQITYMIPQEDAAFDSYPRQKELTTACEREGCIIRVDTIVEWPMDFYVTLASTGVPILKDTRNNFHMSFMSPHFTKWDEIFQYQPDGTWRLAWHWKLSDIDGVARKKYDLAAHL